MKKITDTKFWDIYTLAGNGIMVNLMFLICSIPLVTIGAAWCGLCSSLRFAIRGDRWAAGFKEGISTRFWRMTIAWTVLLLPIIDRIAAILTIVADIEFGKKTLEAVMPMLIGSSVFLLFLIMLAAALILLNVYIPTSVTQWLKNGVTLIFRNPLGIAVMAVMMWLPLATVFLMGVNSTLLLIIYAALYFIFVVFVATMLMKDSLVRLKNEMEALEEAGEGENE